MLGGFLDVVFSKERRARVWNVSAGKWEAGTYPAELRVAEELAGDGRGYLRDLDHDGRAELIFGADVYRWVDDHGEAHYSDRWVPGSELIKSNKPHPPSPDTAPSA